MMRSVQQLPVDYRQIFAVDLQRDKKTALLINGLALIVTAVMGVGMHLVIPIGTLFDMTAGLGPYALRFLVLLVGLVAYIILHEWLHGRVMRLCGAQQVKFGFTGLYAFAGSAADYFTKRAYLAIALAPLVVWGVALLVLNLVVPLPWFWVVYILQITNVSGAMGDVYVTVKFSRMPGDILVQDDGVRMRVYSREG